MILGVKLQENTSKVFTELAIADPEQARAILDMYNVGSAIVVTDKYGGVIFVAYNAGGYISNNPIGRRMSAIKNLQINALNRFEDIIELPTHRTELGRTWQIIAGWWDDYFGRYALYLGRRYYLVTDTKVKYKSKYVVTDNLRIGGG